MATFKKFNKDKRPKRNTQSLLFKRKPHFLPKPFASWCPLLLAAPLIFWRAPLAKN